MAYFPFVTTAFELEHGAAALPRQPSVGRLRQYLATIHALPDRERCMPAGSPMILALDAALMPILDFT